MKDKKIEGMARDLCKHSLTEYCASGRCQNPNCLVNAKALETLYAKGYRKAFDVAREILKDIIEALVDERIEEERKANSALEAQDTASYEVYSYAEDKLGTLITALNIYKKKCTEDWK